MFAAALQNPVDPIIERVSSECDSLFQHIRNGNLPSASFSTQPDAAPQHLGNLDDLDVAEALKRADQIFSSQRSAIIPTPAVISIVDIAQSLHYSVFFCKKPITRPGSSPTLGILLLIYLCCHMPSLERP